MPQFAVSIARTVREDAIVYVEGGNPADAEAAARNEVLLGAVAFTRAAGASEISVDWVQEEEPS